MEIRAQNSYSTSPLTTVSPRQINSTTVPSERRSSQAETDETQQPQQRRVEPGLTQQDKRVIQLLKSRDREVRAHEAAHVAAAGQYATGGPSFTYQKGPDGRSYAIGGEVGIDTSKVANDPEASLRKAEIVRRAALAPAKPSPQDLRVAASANQTAAQARVEIAALRAEEAEQALEERAETVEKATDDSEVIAENAAGPESEVGNENSEASNPVVSANNLASIQSFASEESRVVSVSLFA